MVSSASRDFPRRQAKKAIRFSIMVAGQAGLGKTTLLSTLFEDHICPPVETGEKPTQFNVYSPTESIKAYSFEMEAEDGNRLLIEAFDTPGFDDDVEPEVRLKEITFFLEKTFDEVFEEEQRIHRNPKFEEHRVHALLYLLEPTGLGLKQFDSQLMKQLAQRVNVIPIIAKADGMTSAEKAQFKKQIMADIQRNDIDIFEFPEMCDGSMDQEEAAGCSIKEMMPLSVIGTVAPRTKDMKRGRPYPWGTVEVDNPAHCDFQTLRRALLVSYREDLKEVTEDNLYERYRTEKLLQNSNNASNVAGQPTMMARTESSVGAHM